MTKATGIWVSIIALALGLLVSWFKAGSAYGALEQRLVTVEDISQKNEARIVAAEKQYVDFAVLKETVRNMQSTLEEIKQILLERNKR